MKTLGTLITFLFFFAGCSQVTTGIRIYQNKLTANQCTATLPIKQVERTFDNGIIKLTRTFYASDLGNVLVHEQGSLDDTYEFIVGNISLMYAGFEFKRYRTKDAGRFHDYIEGIDRHGNPIYVLVGTVDQNFELLYANSPKLIESLIACVQKEVPTQLVMEPLKGGSFPLHVKDAVMTDWGPRMLFMHGVIKRKFLRFYLTN